MIEELKDTPNTMVGFRATGEITKADFDTIVLPAVYELVKRTDKLNYLLVLDSALKNFVIGSWLKDAMLILNNIGKWNRAAIVSESDDLNTDIFNKVVPGEYKAFTHAQLAEAITWVGEQDENNSIQVFKEEGEKED